MAIELTPLPLPASADPSNFVDFGREVKGVDPGNLTPEQFAEVYDALYKVCLTATSSNSQSHSHEIRSTSTVLSFSGMCLSPQSSSMP